MRVVVAATLTACLALGLTAPAGADDGAPPSPSEGEQPVLRLEVEPEGELHVGDPIRLRLVAEATAGTRVRVPNQPLAPFEVLERRALPADKLPDGREAHVFEIDLLRFEAGPVTVPALDVRVVSTDGAVETLHTEPLPLEVISRVGNEPNATPREATQPVQVLEDDYTLAWVLGGLLVAALLVAAGYAYARHRARRPRPAPPPAPARPPWDVALEQLERLARQREHWLNDGRGEDYVDRVSDVVRDYLGRRYGFDGLESTTDEVVAALSAERHPELPMTSVVTLLSDCDLVKFAKAAPDLALCEDVHAQARALVEKSTPRSAPATSDDTTRAGVTP